MTAKRKKGGDANGTQADDDAVYLKILVPQALMVLFLNPAQNRRADAFLHK